MNSLRVTVCRRNKSRGIKNWYARVFDTVTKRIRYESLGTPVKAEALEILSERRAAGAFDPDPGIPTLAQARDEYVGWLEAKGSCAQTQMNAHNAFRGLESLLSCKVTALDKKRLYDAFQAQNGHLKPSSYNTKAAMVKAAVNRCLGMHSIEIRNPAAVLGHRKASDAERGFWTEGQVDRILDRAPDGRRRLLWAFMAFCGLRIHEALKAVPSDIRDGFLHVTGKGGKFAKLPLSSRMRAELDRSGWAWDFSGLDDSLYAIQRAAAEALPEGFEGNANNHRFRHSFASNLIRGGANPKAVQRLMRHSSIQTTLGIYSHVMMDDLRGELEKVFGKA